MVSYHHKSGQRMMLKVVRLLRNAGFKVWMDVDDMRECKEILRYVRYHYCNALFLLVFLKNVYVQYLFLK